MERHHDVGFSAGNLAFTTELAGFRGFADCRDRSRINLLESNQRQVSLHPSFLTFLVGITAGCLYALCGEEARRRLEDNPPPAGRVPILPSFEWLEEAAEKFPHLYGPEADKD